ncbi:bifunctional lysylphosphatidylglycerol flippase/synthetase MprF [Kineosporia sp. J2-2]|uniref:Bifunctional lysylphosphatidylglycerol flippase/synthetase MprF n=1 Tax=Kineosporia corallincola TaxID=2835133 RepID=A0ABS5TRD4_9ACTN|nr:bifunctional lysylphosphatidylglycerol flippase/synthetase MprF [Kineosporia corallincola]MBT0773357.1 bifunctional lysylphosphatidylglycerol flippase/synthetase MprF [Kineosporia corallincola]
MSDESHGGDHDGDGGGNAGSSRARGRLIAQLAVFGAMVAAVVVLQQRLSGYPWHRLHDDLAALGARPLVLALLATALSYSIMICYDALALDYVEHAMPIRRYAAASFVATAFGNTLGASAVVGAALRARVYSAWGLPAFAITRVTGFNLVTLSLGSSVLIAVGLAWGPSAVLSWLPFGRVVSMLLAALLLGGVAGYVLWCGAHKNPVTVRDWRIDRPTRWMAATQLVVSVIEWLTMAAVLYALLPAGHGLAFAPFAVLFVLATTLGLLSNVPGGLGVVEAVLVLALSSDEPSTGLVTALVAYRLVYYLIPLALAAVVLAGLEARRHPDRTSNLVRAAGVLTPSLLAVLLVVHGGIMIVTGELLLGGPPSSLSAFTASLVGVGILLLARGLHRRLRGAWALTLLVLTVFAATHRSFLAVAAVALAVLLLLARRAFNRSTAVLTGPRNWIWPAVLAGVAALLWWRAAWLDPGPGEQPWPSAMTGDGPALSRLALAAAVLALIVAGTRLQVPDAGASIASVPDLERAVPVLARASHGNASLLWTGDKQLLFSSGGDALLMYRVQGRSWVVMGDPVGDPGQFGELVRRFLDLCDSRCGRPVFYCVRDDLAGLYREHGLALVKLGEEAMIPLAGFAMTGSRRAKLRSECRASARAGVVVEIVEGERLAAVLPQLREVSDRWLDDRRTQEKSFSLGAFDEDYVARFPVAVASIDDRVVAFASLWTSGARHEVKVDLMRRCPEAPRTVMTHMFVESMTWARENGYDTFNIGMAPLSGLRTDGTGSFWERVGHVLWTHGEHFYNFQGLRQFKERFDPSWETRYVASLGGPALPVMMLDVAVLVAGGVRGMVPHLHKLPVPREKPAAVPHPRDPRDPHGPHNRDTQDDRLPAAPGSAGRL